MKELQFERLNSFDQMFLMPLQLQIYTNIEDDAKCRTPLQTKQMNRHPNTFICKYLFIARTRFYCKSFSKKIPSTLISTFFKQTNEMLKQQTNEKKKFVKHTFFHWHCERRKKKHTNKSFDKKRDRNEKWIKPFTTKLSLCLRSITITAE